MRKAVRFIYLNRMASHVQDWYDRLPAHWQDRAQRIRELILEAAPGIEEKVSYHLPFYHHRGWMCYLHFNKEARLIVGFTRGVHMTDPEGLFAVTDHALIRHYLPPLPGERMNEAPFLRLLDEAVRVNDLIAEGKRGKTARRRREG